MMHKIRKFYYDNKPMIWRIIFFIIFAFALLQLANYIAKLNNNKTLENTNTNIANTTTNKVDTYISSDKSALTGTSTDKNTLNMANKIIEEFVKSCNDGKINEAYDFLSEECKEELYPNIEIFKNNYIDTIFKGNIKKIASIQNWSVNIYKVNYKEDIMATGNSSQTSIQDFITIVKQDGNYKLNINNFVERQELGRKSNQYNIETNVVYRKVFIDYEEYVIKFVNKTENPILLDTKESTKTMYIQDSKGVKYYALTNELIDSFLKVNSGFSTQIKIKFAKSYNNESLVKSINFSDIVLNYNDYLSGDKNRVNLLLSI